MEHRSRRVGDDRGQGQRRRRRRGGGITATVRRPTCRFWHSESSTGFAGGEAMMRHCRHRWRADRSDDRHGAVACLRQGHAVDRGSGGVAAGDERTTTINAAGARMLATLGVWDGSKPRRRRSAGSPLPRCAGRRPCRATASGIRAQLGFHRPPMGYVVGNALSSCRPRRGGEDRQVDMLQECALSSRQLLGDTTEMELLGHDGGTEQRRAALIVACDGARSALPRLPGLPRVRNAEPRPPSSRSSRRRRIITTPPISVSCLTALSRLCR